MKKAWIYLSIIAIVIGFSCIFFSFFIDPKSSVYAITIAIGVSLLPTGIISIITSISSSQIVESNLRKRLDETTINLKSSIKDLEVTNDFLTKSKMIGVKMVYKNRGEALESFLLHLEEYSRRVDHTKGEIVFVGSSFKGLIEDEPKYADQLKRILENSKDNCTCKFLLTHPQYSSFREAQEDRPEGGIAKEILHAISWLEDRGLHSSQIKVYKGTPTCFMIASKERMLINPYTYQKEAYKSFCLELENTKNENSIFSSYWTNHFHKPWYGDEKRKDHFMVPNTLGYRHEVFDGPFPINKSTENIDPFADFFIITDTGSFYIAVNIRGMETEIVYNREKNGSCNKINVGDKLKVRLLDLSNGQCEWIEMGEFSLNEIRNGFWHCTFKEKKSFHVFSMLGLFDDDNINPFKFEGAHPLLENQPLPILWKWLI